MDVFLSFLLKTFLVPVTMGCVYPQETPCTTDAWPVVAVPSLLLAEGGHTPRHMLGLTVRAMPLIQS